jgi:hypothetical protein
MKVALFLFIIINFVAPNLKNINNIKCLNISISRSDMLGLLEAASVFLYFVPWIMIAAANVLEWVGLILGAAIAGAFLGFLLVRWRLVRRVRAELGKEKVLLVTNSRLGSLGEGRAAKVLDAGILMLLNNGLYYHAWFKRKDVFIPGPAITYIGVAEANNGQSMERGAVILHFLNTMGKEDGFVIRMLSPDQWVSAVKAHLITG